MPIPHISYSQYRSYTSCPRSWYLSKVRQAEEKQSWYIPIGTAVHDAIEERLHFGLTDQNMEDYFYPLITEQMKIEPDLTKWLAGGPETAPITHKKALKRAQDCFEKALQELEDIDVWEVEYDATGGLPGLSVPIKAFVDIIGEHKKKGPVILDWKTGSTKPDNFQLETYAALLRYNAHSHGGKIYSSEFQGRYVMLAPGSPNTRYVDLREVDPEEVGKKYQGVVDRIEGKHYEAKAGFGCKFCFHQDNCLVNKGMTPRSLHYDKSEEDGYPF
jgi:putative RecB family exonuclease